MRHLLPLGLLLALAVATPAAAAPFDLPGQGIAPTLALAPDGTGHVAYAEEPPGAPAVVHYCRLIPGSTDCADRADLPVPAYRGINTGGRAFVLLDGSTVRVVVPRYVAGDVLQWVSTAGGAAGTFTGPTTLATGRIGTNQERVLALAPDRLIATTWNPEPYVRTLPLDGSANARGAVLPGAGRFLYDTDAALHGDVRSPIVSAWAINPGARSTIAFWRGSGDLDDPAGWTGPTVVGEGDAAQLSGGARGTYMVHGVYRTTFVDRLAVRRFDGVGFGAPVPLGDETGHFPTIWQDGAADGRVWTAWRRNGDPAEVRLAVSADGGASFSPPWTLATDEGTLSDFQGAARPGGTGWLVWAHNGRSTVTASPLTPARAPRAADVVRLPRACASRRSFTIRLRTPRGVGVEQAAVLVNGRSVRVVRGARLTAPVNLRGLPRGRFRVQIRVTLAGGRVVTGTRTYRTCEPRRRSGGRPPV